ncbi:dehydrogenase/reductase SDR family member 11-like [Schistocerca gregaria]|uniref:dehydrogenase/reductase SDR family member 11-like n=1 Tax=Schistocerca gregaria TaxID=7010 RepID=UPI00211DFA0E|nr:dehydrogenase/reductase SDR family member 11-like [Schistocerca gregaria]
MERYRGRVAVVTGASQGVSAAVARRLLRQGFTVVGLARRPDKVKALELKEAPGKLHAIQTDISSEDSILSAFKWIEDNLGGVDVLVNNAAVFPAAPVASGETEDWKRILEVNVLGLSVCTREAVQDMLSRGVDDGFIVHIGSDMGHLPPSSTDRTMYGASKHAVRVLLEGLRKDLVARGSKIRVGEISPGAIRTEGLMGVMHEFPEIAKTMPCMEPEDIADAVVYMLSQHPRVQVYDIIMYPTGRPA